MSTSKCVASFFSVAFLCCDEGVAIFSSLRDSLTSDMASGRKFVIKKAAEKKCFFKLNIIYYLILKTRFRNFFQLFLNLSVPMIRPDLIMNRQFLLSKDV